MLGPLLRTGSGPLDPFRVKHPVTHIVEMCVGVCMRCGCGCVHEVWVCAWGVGVYEVCVHEVWVCAWGVCMGCVGVCMRCGCV